MRGTSFDIFAVAASCAVLFAGCEWTSSGGDSSWSGSYDNMNFSGTYRTGVAVTAAAPTDETVSVKETVGELVPLVKKYGGKIHGGVVAGSVVISTPDYTYSDTGGGALVGNVPGAGNGTINYTSGGWTITMTADPPSLGKISAVYAYSTTVSGGSEGTTTISSITVSQVGQNLTMSFSNGLVMAGKFGSVNESASGYNAQFEVKSSGNRFVGTLDSTTGSKVMDGTWTSGKNTYDVHGVGGASTSRAAVAE